MDRAIRLSSQTRKLLVALLEGSRDWHYGYDLSRLTGLKSGTIYPILMRLAERKWLETRWEAANPGRPPRHLYRLTPNGLTFAKEACKTKESGRAGPSRKQCNDFALASTEGSPKPPSQHG